MRTIIRLSRQANIPTLVHHQTIPQTQKWLREGARFVLYSTDARSLHNAFRDEFGAIRAVGEQLTGAKSAKVGESKEVI